MRQKLITLLVLAVFVTGCAAGRAFRRGQDAARSGDWDQVSGVITIPASAVKRMLAVSPQADASTSGLTWRLAG